jgi:pyrrolidone-carboxylate peptidase
MSQKFVKTVLVTVLVVPFQNDEKSNEAIAELVGEKLDKLKVKENVLTINFKTTKVDKKDVTPESLVLNHEDFLVKDEDGNLSVMTPQAFANDYSIAR